MRKKLHVKRERLCHLKLLASLRGHKLAASLYNHFSAKWFTDHWTTSAQTHLSDTLSHFLLNFRRSWHPCFALSFCKLKQSKGLSLLLQYDTLTSATSWLNDYKHQRTQSLTKMPICCMVNLHCKLYTWFLCDYICRCIALSLVGLHINLKLCEWWQREQLVPLCTGWKINSTRQTAPLDHIQYVIISNQFGA